MLLELQSIIFSFCDNYTKLDLLKNTNFFEKIGIFAQSLSINLTKHAIFTKCS